MREFYHRKEVCPFLRVSITKDTKVGFELLVHPLCFSISLWIVGSEELEVILQEASKFSYKGQCELRALI